VRVAHVKSRYDAIGGVESMLEGLMPEFLTQPDADPLLVFVSDRPDPDLEARLTAGGKVPLCRLPWNGLSGAPASATRLA
jgi:hypothetical protein